MSDRLELSSLNLSRAGKLSEAFLGDLGAFFSLDAEGRRVLVEFVAKRDASTNREGMKNDLPVIGDISREEFAAVAEMVFFAAKAIALESVTFEDLHQDLEKLEYSEPQQSDFSECIRQLIDLRPQIGAETRKVLATSDVVDTLTGIGVAIDMRAVYKKNTLEDVVPVLLMRLRFDVRDQVVCQVDEESLGRLIDDLKRMRDAMAVAKRRIRLMDDCDDDKHDD